MHSTYARRRTNAVARTPLLTALTPFSQLYPVPPNASYCGRTEEIIGNWLEKNPAKRAQLVLATKVAGPQPANFLVAQREKTLTGKLDPSAPLPRHEPAQIKRALAASLARLKTSYVDLYQLHWPDRYTPLWGNNVYQKGLESKHEQQPRECADRIPFDDIARCRGELIEEGLVRAWGVSNESSFGVCAWVESCTRLGVPLPVSIQNDHSLCDRRFEGELAETCSSVNHNLGLLAFGALNGGTLSAFPDTRPPVVLDIDASTIGGKYSGGVKPAGARHTAFPNFQHRYLAPRSLHAADKYAALAAANGLTAAQLALAWSYSRHYMCSVIIGATKLDQLVENIKAADIVLPKAVLGAIDAIHLEQMNPNVKG